LEIKAKPFHLRRRNGFGYRKSTKDWFSVHECNEHLCFVELKQRNVCFCLTIKKTRLSTGVGVLLFFRLIAKPFVFTEGFFCGFQSVGIFGSVHLSVELKKTQAYLLLIWTKRIHLWLFWTVLWKL